MPYQVTSDNIEISPSMTELAKAKLTRLRSHLPQYLAESSTFRIVMNASPDQQFIVKIEAVVKGKKLFTDETHPILETAIIESVEELDRQIERELKKEKTGEWEKMRELKRFPDEDPEKV